MLVVFSPTFVAYAKIMSRHDFVAPLTGCRRATKSHFLEHSI